MRRLFINLFMFFRLTFRSIKGMGYPFIIGATKVTCFKQRREVVRYMLKEKIETSDLGELARIYPDEKFILLTAIVNDRVKVNVHRLLTERTTPTTEKVYNPQWGINGLFTFGLTYRREFHEDGTLKGEGSVITTPKTHKEAQGLYFDPTDPITSWSQPLSSREDDLVDEAYHADSLLEDQTACLA